MKHNYTENQLIQYIYGELSITDKFEIEDAMENDEYLALDYKQLYRAYKYLPKVKFAPTDISVANVLNYSRNNLATA